MANAELLAALFDRKTFLVVDELRPFRHLPPLRHAVACSYLRLAVQGLAVEICCNQWP